MTIKQDASNERFISNKAYRFVNEEDLERFKKLKE